MFNFKSPLIPQENARAQYFSGKVVLVLLTLAIAGCLCYVGLNHNLPTLESEVGGGTFIYFKTPTGKEILTHVNSPYDTQKLKQEGRDTIPRFFFFKGDTMMGTFGIPNPRDGIWAIPYKSSRNSWTDFPKVPTAEGQMVVTAGLGGCSVYITEHPTDPNLYRGFHDYFQPAGMNKDLITRDMAKPFYYGTQYNIGSDGKGTYKVGTITGIDDNFISQEDAENLKKKIGQKLPFNGNTLMEEKDMNHIYTVNAELSFIHEDDYTVPELFLTYDPSPAVIYDPEQNNGLVVADGGSQVVAGVFWALQSVPVYGPSSTEYKWNRIYYAYRNFQPTGSEMGGGQMPKTSLFSRLNPFSAENRAE